MDHHDGVPVEREMCSTAVSPATETATAAVTSASPSDDSEAPDRGTTTSRRARVLGVRLLRVGSAFVLVAVFGLLLPRLSSYVSVWHVLRSVGGLWLPVIAVVTVTNLLANWALICSVLPNLRMRQAAMVNLSSTAVANTVPAGGAIALGVTWNMLTSWGFAAQRIVAYTLVSGLWSFFCKVGAPVVALVLLAAVGHAGGALGMSALLGAVLLVAAIGLFVVYLHSERAAVAHAVLAQRLVTGLARLTRRGNPSGAYERVLAFRDHMGSLVSRRGWRISAATVVSDLALFTVLLICLRACGVTNGQVPWEVAFAGLALARLLAAVPITPGGLGVVELGLTGYLAVNATTEVTSHIVAAVLLYRTLTFAVQIPLGAVTYLFWRTRGVRSCAARF